MSISSLSARPLPALYALLCLMAPLWACAGPNAYGRAYSQSQGAVQAAQAAQADAHPLAAKLLQQANHQLSQAQKLQDTGHPHRALHLLRRAEADAQLALALTQRDAYRAIKQEHEDGGGKPPEASLVP